MVKRLLLLLTVMGSFSPVHATLVRVSSATALYGESGYQSGFYDPGTGYAYFGSSSAVAVSTESQVSRFTTPLLAYNTSFLLSSGAVSMALLDSTSGYAYFASTRTPADISKMRLSDGVQVASATLLTTGSIGTGVVDATNGYIYWGTATDPAQIVLMNMTDLSLSGYLTLPSAASPLTTALIDESHTYAYFASSTTPSVVTRVRMSTFTLNASLTLDATDGPIVSGAIDSSLGYAWFGTNQSPGKVIRLRLSTFTRNQALTLNTGENSLTSAVYDPTYKSVYFGTDTSSGMVVQVNGQTMLRTETLILPGGEDYLRSAAIDATNHYAYFGTYTTPPRLVQVDVIGGAPEITTQPNSQTVGLGQSVTFTIAATGRSLTYQWKRDGTALSGQTGTSYTIATAALSDDGARFTCTVTSSSGTTTSSEALLTVQPDVHAYPNPWRADRHTGSMIFNGLPSGSHVKIYTLNAQWVRSLTEQGGIATWDLRNDGGENVASGYYFYVVDTPNNRQDLRGKIAVIR